MTPICPTHDTAMARRKSRYGHYYACTISGCDVLCGSGETSTPANKKTRQARMRAHAMFDPLWRRKKQFSTRGAAYLWLQQVMNLPNAQAHIGMFTFEQCEQLCTFIRGLLMQGATA